MFDSFGTVAGLLDNDMQRLAVLRGFCEQATRDKSLMGSVERILARSGVSGDDAAGWIGALPDEILRFAESARADQSLLDLLIERGILPRYAFPVDVVALWTRRPSRWNYGEEIQRDLGIALSEYALGAEVVVDGWIHKSEGLYSPFEENPTYEQTGWYFECPTCHHTEYWDTSGESDPPGLDICPICGSPATINPKYGVLPAIEPRGFRTNWKRSERKYRGGGQQRAGYASPARLVAGENAEQGDLRFDDRLYIHQRTGDLFIINRGPYEQEYPGFLICPRCGSSLRNPNAPHDDPTIGGACHGGPANRSVLIHHFNTDIALFGVNFPGHLVADPRTPSGRAVWHSFGTALRHGAATYLQVNPEELATGIRAWVIPGTSNFSAEVFLYDTLPNGAGYAIEVADEITDILEQSRSFAANCPSGCEGACYKCLIEYGNQSLHPTLDRHLAKEVIGFVLDGIEPDLMPSDAAAALARLEPFARGFSFAIKEQPGGKHEVIGGDPAHGRIVRIIPVHTLGTQAPRKAGTADGGIMHPVVVNDFDLTRRPYWVWDRLIPIIEGQADQRVLI